MGPDNLKIFNRKHTVSYYAVKYGWRRSYSMYFDNLNCNHCQYGASPTCRTLSGWNIDAALRKITIDLKFFFEKSLATSTFMDGFVFGRRTRCKKFGSYIINFVPVLTGLMTCVCIWWSKSIIMCNFLV